MEFEQLNSIKRENRNMNVNTLGLCNIKFIEAWKMCSYYYENNVRQRKNETIKAYLAIADRFLLVRLRDKKNMH